MQNPSVLFLFVLLSATVNTEKKRDYQGIEGITPTINNQRKHPSESKKYLSFVFGDRDVPIIASEEFTHLVKKMAVGLPGEGGF